MKEKYVKENSLVDRFLRNSGKMMLETIEEIYGKIVEEGTHLYTLRIDGETTYQAENLQDFLEIKEIISNGSNQKVDSDLEKFTGYTIIDEEDADKKKYTIKTGDSYLQIESGERGLEATIKQGDMFNEEELYKQALEDQGFERTGSPNY